MTAINGSQMANCTHSAGVHTKSSQSMSGTITALRTAFMGTIVPGIQAQIPDLRVGVGSFDSMPVPPQGNPGMPGDYTLWVRQPLTDNVAAAQAAFNTMNTIDTDAPGFFGGDGPENSTEAAYEVVEGQGNRGHELDPAALRAVRNARDPMGNGWVPRVSPERDCGADAEHARYGWGCFEEGRVPVVVLTSDADWYDGCAQNVPRTPGDPNPGHNCDELVDAFRAQTEAWAEGTSFGATALQDTFGFLTHPLNSPTDVLTTTSLFAMFALLYTAWKKRLPWPMVAYVAVVLALMLIPETVTARPRFVYTAFPLFLSAGAWWPEDDETSWAHDGWTLLIALCAAGLVTLTALYGVYGAIP